MTYSFICKKCEQKFKHASDIQDHLMTIHKLSLDETYNPENIKAIKL